MNNKISRSVSYGSGMARSTKAPLSKTYSTIFPRFVILCESCGQSHKRGKNHLYDYPIEVDNDLMCRICLQPLVDPVDTLCGHTFCYSCIFEHIRRCSYCPVDRQPVCERDIKQSSLLVRNILDKLTVVCPNTAYCDHSMPRYALESHLKMNCLGSYVQCPRVKRGCGHVGPRVQLEEHLWTCPYGLDCDIKTGKKLPVVEDKPCIIEIVKGSKSLGLKLSQCERTGALIVDEVVIGSPAHRDGRIKPGDQVLYIDDKDFTYKSLAQAKLSLQSIHHVIKLTVLRVAQGDQDGLDVEEVTLVRDNCRPLGISLHTYISHRGVYINHLISGSPAEDCGSLLIGDRILEVNGIDVRQANIDETATLMANSVGTLQLLVAHRRRASPSVSDDSVVSSVPSLKRKERVYEELLCPTGFTIGSGKCIIIKKLPEESFGINISGGTELGLPIFISHINSDSAMPSTVQRGDIIVSINSLNLTDKTHEEAVQIIKSFTNHALIKMELVQGDDTYTENGHLSPEWTSWMEKYINRRKSPLEYSVVLKRRGSDRLGFSIVGGAGSYKGDSPIYIKSVATNSIAFNDGRLQCGDQITSINGVPLHNRTSDEVVSIISQSYGDISINIVPLESNE